MKLNTQLIPFLVLIYLKSSLAKLIDLTWPFENGKSPFEDTQPFTFYNKITKIGENDSWYASNDICIGEHTGTHMDAPYHYYRYGLKIHEIPVENLYVKGIKIDLTNETMQLGKEARLLQEHLVRWEANKGHIPEKCVILVQFGWAQHYGDETKYFGAAQPTDTFDFPGVSIDAVEWIINNRNIVGIGTDTAGLDPGKSTTFEAQRLLSQNNIYILKNLNIPVHFPDTGFMLHVMPMKILEGTGAPLRLFAHNLPKPKYPVIPWYQHALVVTGCISYFIVVLYNRNPL